MQQSIAEKIGYREGISLGLVGLGLVKSLQDEDEQALLFFGRALALSETAGSKPGQAFALAKLSRSYLKLGDYRKAFERDSRRAEQAG
jgi:hypothetical protein